MLQINSPTPDLWESVLPHELRALPPDLERTDRLLQDDQLTAPFTKSLDENLGRPTIPLATYLRMMHLKIRYGLSYETLVETVMDSVRWRSFCRIPFQDRVPDPSTLARLTNKMGLENLIKLHNLVLEDLRANNLLRNRKVLTGTTVWATDNPIHLKYNILTAWLRRLWQKVSGDKE